MIQSIQSRKQDLEPLWDANGMCFMKTRNFLDAFHGGGFYVLHLFLEQLSVVGFQDVIGKISLSPTKKICQQFHVNNFMSTISIEKVIPDIIFRQAKKKRKMSRRKSTVSTNSQWMSTKAFFSCGKDVSQ